MARPGVGHEFVTGRGAAQRDRLGTERLGQPQPLHALVALGIGQSLQVGRLDVHDQPGARSATASRRPARIRLSPSLDGPIATITRSEVSHGVAASLDARPRSTMAFRRSPARRTASSRNALCVPTGSAASAASAGGRSTSTTSSADSNSASGTVSTGAAPITPATMSARLSSCRTSSVAKTSMPASRSSSTSCQRIAWRPAPSFTWAR
jgi:hypothetical protein